MSNITGRQLVERIEKALLRMDIGLQSLARERNISSSDDTMDEIYNGFKCALLDTRTLKRRHFPEEKDD